MKTSVEGQKRAKGIYLLPNLFTTAGLFAGFYAIVAAQHARFDNAAIAIFVAMIMDGLDGRIARLTHTQTPFGAQYDSLSDMVAFGVAPALVMYSWALHLLGKFGWLSAFIFAAAGALRLARFNVQAETMNKKYFQGLAIPSAAGLLASLTWLGHEYHLKVNYPIAILIALVTITTAVLMVSNLRYYSFKEFDLKGRIPFVTVLLVVLIFVAISIDPPTVLFIGFLTYALSGPITTFWKLNKKRRRRKYRSSK